jgi:AraC-like DNA-binding protein
MVITPAPPRVEVRTRDRDVAAEAVQTVAYLTGLLTTAGATVAEVARGWGFADPGRFADYYRACYGVSPSRTLSG